MKSIHVFISQQEPLLLGDASGTGFYQETAGYVPGGTLRGAVAARLMTDCTSPQCLDDHASCPDRADCPFWQVFGGEREPAPLFGNGYPAQVGPAYPFPATARTCKRCPGFQPDEETCEEHHGVFDTLVQQFVYELVSDPQFLQREELQPGLGTGWATLPGRYEPRCPEPKCDANVMPAEGIYTAAGGQPGYARPPTLGRATHVGINRARGVAEDALLFTQETVQPEDGVSFWARVVAAPGYADVLEAALAGEHVLGRGRSRGMGAVAVATWPSPDGPSVAERLGLFDAAVKRELARYAEADGRVASDGEGVYFALTQRSDALLTRGRLLASRLEPEELGFPAGVMRVRSWARTATVGGWHSAAQLPYRTRQAVERGAVYLFYAPDGVDQKMLRDRLNTLEQIGIGEERERGYGQVTVCAPFHYRLIVQA